VKNLLQQQDVSWWFLKERPSDSEVLTMRLVDRVLRPLSQVITMLKFK
jgi:hypothetical protein